MITSVEIVLLVMLFIGVCVAIWWFVIAERFKTYLKNYSYSRGANILNGQTAKLSCDGDNEICVYRATQICTRPGSVKGLDGTNFETSSLEPIAAGDKEQDGDAHVAYGDFNPKTTIDLTDSMGKEVNGKTSHEYTFNVDKKWKAPNGVSCNGDAQLIAVYTCVPPGTTCKQWTPKKNSSDGS